MLTILSYNIWFLAHESRSTNTRGHIANKQLLFSKQLIEIKERKKEKGEEEKESKNKRNKEGKISTIWQERKKETNKQANAKERKKERKKGSRKKRKKKRNYIKMTNAKVMAENDTTNSWFFMPKKHTHKKN